MSLSDAIRNQYQLLQSSFWSAGEAIEEAVYPYIQAPVSQKLTKALAAFGLITVTPVAADIAANHFFNGSRPAFVQRAYADEISEEQSSLETKVLEDTANFIAAVSNAQTPEQIAPLLDNISQYLSNPDSLQNAFSILANSSDFTKEYSLEKTVQQLQQYRGRNQAVASQIITILTPYLSVPQPTLAPTPAQLPVPAPSPSPIEQLPEAQTDLKIVTDPIITDPAEIARILNSKPASEELPYRPPMRKIVTGQGQQSWGVALNLGNGNRVQYRNTQGPNGGNSQFSLQGRAKNGTRIGYNERTSRHGDNINHSESSTAGMPGVTVHRSTREVTRGDDWYKTESSSFGANSQAGNVRIGAHSRQTPGRTDTYSSVNANARLGNSRQPIIIPYNEQTRTTEIIPSLTPRVQKAEQKYRENPNFDTCIGVGDAYLRYKDYETARHYYGLAGKYDYQPSQTRTLERKLERLERIKQ